MAEQRGTPHADAALAAGVPEGYTPLKRRGQLHKWDTPGVSLEGEFLGVKETTFRGRPNKIGQVRPIRSAEIVAFSCPMQLADLLAMVKLGSQVFIRYTGTTQSSSGMTVKTFEVGVR